MQRHVLIGHWKVNLVSFRYLITDEFWKDMVSKSGMTEHEFMNAILERVNNNEPQNRIWHPLNTW